MTRTLVAALVLALVALTGPARAQVSVTEVTSPGGITAWLAPETALPFVALEIVFPGGATLDPEGAEGATVLMSDMLAEGAGPLDAQSFAEATEAIAAQISFDAGPDAVTVSARFLTEVADDAADLLRLALAAPRFDADAFERARARAVSQARSAERSPNALASRRLAELTWGTHPYARPHDGTEDSLRALTPDDLRAAHARALARDRVHVAAVGDIDADTLGALLDHVLGTLPEATTPLPDRATVGLDGGVTHVAFDGPQAVIAFGQPGIGPDDPDFFAAFVLSEALGGGRFGTRLMRALRTERGLTYGVGAFLVNRRLGDTLQGRFATTPARADEAIEVVRAEWARMAEEGLSAEELAAIQTYLTGAYPLRFDGNARIAAILASMQLQGFAPDYIATRNDKVAAVTVEEVRAAAARLLDPEGLHFVVVGPQEDPAN
ncbi:M16 family metallopeptidase [Rhodobaculum claviforme]|uniref:Peptidase M16 n=1 Tax=Rhodobaculum claviforme TaxID=1549854 RepID=A0A934TMH8_9RHOB|nr:pitrilysin family protein [Rhodobaculum claviforme]MBK5928196.1 peptidase M16 [Rhodobaculum claviforme]